MSGYFPATFARLFTRIRMQNCTEMRVHHTIRCTIGRSIVDHARAWGEGRVNSWYPGVEKLRRYISHRQALVSSPVKYDRVDAAITVCPTSSYNPCTRLMECSRGRHCSRHHLAEEANYRQHRCKVDPDTGSAISSQGNFYDLLG